MNILYLVSTLEKVGPTRQLFYIISNLDRSRFNPIVVTLSPERPKSLKAKFEEAGIKIYALNMGRLRGLFCAKREVMKILERENIHLIHSNFIRSDRIAVSSGLKNIIGIRYDPMFVYPAAYGRFLGKMIARAHMGIHCRADVAIACSRSIAQKLQEYTGREFAYIRNGVDLSAHPYVAPAERKGNAETASLFITAGSGGKGNNEEGKNIATIVTAFQKMANDPMVLQVAGHHGLTTDISENKNIVALGFVDNMPALFGRSDYFISASLSEGMPNAVLEAMANGLPVLLSDIPPHREIVEGTVLEKYLFPPTDADALVARVKKIVADDYELLSHTARQIIETAFDAKKVSEQYMELYTRLAGNEHDR